MGPTGLLNTRFFKEYKLFCLCIPNDLELSNRLLLSLHSMIALSVNPSLYILVQAYFLLLTLIELTCYITLLFHSSAAVKEKLIGVRQNAIRYNKFL